MIHTIEQQRNIDRIKEKESEIGVTSAESKSRVGNSQPQRETE